MRFLLALFILFAMNTSASAITFAQSKVADPIAKGEMCEVSELASWGSYVYQWPSKFDLVFEPFVTYIWACEKSGYVSYAKDFDKLSDREKTRIAAFLKAHPPDEAESSQARFDRMVAIYALRDLTRQDKAYLMRAGAWVWRDDPKADEYRAKALTLHKEILEHENPQGIPRIESLYIAGFYSWKLGDKAAAEPYFEAARKVKWKDDDGKERVGNDYVNALIDEVRAGKADDKVRFGDGGDAE